MKYILLLFLPVFLSAQYISENAFKTTTVPSDTLSVATAQDTLDWRGGIGGKWIPWTPITNYLTAVEKGAGNALPYKISGESGWMWFEDVQIRIRGDSDTITGRSIHVGSFDVITVIVLSDTSDNYANYVNTKIGAK